MTRVYISVDMEGATGVVHRDQLGHEGKDYERARRLLTGDVRAAVDGALKAGAREILVNDAHGTMRNILIEDLPSPVRLLSGPASVRNKPLCQTQGADQGWDLAFFIGYHARAGAEPGLLAHTWVGSLIHEVRINGQVAGETAINASVLGHYGVPVGLATGGDDLVAEAKELLGEVETVTVKHSLGPTAAECWTPADTRDWIVEAAERAVERKEEFQPLKQGEPVKVVLVMHTREQARLAALAEGVEPDGARSVKAVAPTAPQAMALAWTAVESALRTNSSWLS